MMLCEKCLEGLAFLQSTFEFIGVLLRGRRAGGRVFRSGVGAATVAGEVMRLKQVIIWLVSCTAGYKDSVA